MFPRHVQARIVRALADTPAVFVAGPRQAGKSTLVRQIRPDQYLTMDRATTRAGASTDPDGFLAGVASPVALDEVQRVPDLLLALKAAIDEDRRPGRFLLTGSANVLMLPTVADALPGRMEIIELWPLSAAELEGSSRNFVDAVYGDELDQVRSVRASSPRLLERVLRGGFPEVVQRPVDRRPDWFESYLTAVIEREVRDLSNVGNVSELGAMIRLIAARSGSPFNLADVARDAGLSQSTARRYLGLLQAVFLVVQVPAWTTSLTTRVVRAPKQFMVDSGLAAHVLGIDFDRLISQPHLSGPLLETFVAMEVRKQIGWSRLRPGLAHFRSRRGDEVDLVLEARDGSLVGIEVKASMTVRSSDFDGLRALATLAGDRFNRGVLLHDGDEIVPFGPNLFAAPVSMLWQPT